MAAFGDDDQSVATRRQTAQQVGLIGNGQGFQGRQDGNLEFDRVQLVLTDGVETRIPERSPECRVRDVRRQLTGSFQRPATAAQLAFEAQRREGRRRIRQ